MLTFFGFAHGESVGVAAADAMVAAPLLASAERAWRGNGIGPEASVGCHMLQRPDRTC